MKADPARSYTILMPCYATSQMDPFGCIAIQQGTPKSGERWRIERILWTPFGEALFALLQSEFFSDFDKIVALEVDGEIPFGVFQPIFKPYFSDWNNNLFLPGWTFREGVHVFKVSLGRIWRRIALPANVSLQALASAILNSVSFGHDHLYQFSYRNRSGVQEEINHPYMDEGPWVDETSIGDVPIRIGQTLTFRYDFGDNWEFTVTLERVDTDTEIDQPTVLDSHGESPEQYPRWE